MPRTSAGRTMQPGQDSMTTILIQEVSLQNFLRHVHRCLDIYCFLETAWYSSTDPICKASARNWEMPLDLFMRSDWSVIKHSKVEIGAVNDANYSQIVKGIQRWLKNLQAFRMKAPWWSRPNLYWNLKVGSVWG